jgi:DUF1009 family protein
VLFAEKARSLGLPLVCVGIRDEAPAELIPLVKRFYWCGIARLGRMIRCFKREGVRRVVMAGKVQKTRMHTPWRILSLLPDLRTLRAWYLRRRTDNKDDTLLLTVIDEFQRDGITFDSALTFCPELLVSRRVLTRRQPSSLEEKDIDFGWELAKRMGDLDVGQSVAVKEREVLAVEAIEAIVIDQDQTVALADRYGIAIVAR